VEGCACRQEGCPAGGTDPATPAPATPPPSQAAPLDPPYQAVEPGPVLVRDGPLAAVAGAGVGGALVLVLLSLLVAAGSLVVRFRRARGTERGGDPALPAL
jgi:hypothetical protein